MISNMLTLARILIKNAIATAYTMGLNEEQHHWLTLSSRILNCEYEPGASQEGYSAPDVRLPEHFPLIGKL